MEKYVKVLYGKGFNMWIKLNFKITMWINF